MIPWRSLSRGAAAGAAPADVNNTSNVGALLLLLQQGDTKISAPTVKYLRLKRKKKKKKAIPVQYKIKLSARDVYSGYL